jgi:hypothetical protein
MVGANGVGFASNDVAITIWSGHLGRLRSFLSIYFNSKTYKLTLPMRRCFDLTIKPTFHEKCRRLFLNCCAHRRFTGGENWQSFLSPEWLHGDISPSRLAPGVDIHHQYVALATSQHSRAARGHVGHSHDDVNWNVRGGVR